MATQILRPNGKGTYEEWTYPLFTDHYLEVDELSQDGDTTHISDDGITIPNGTTSKDTFLLDNWAHGAQHVEKIEVSFYGKLSAGSGNIAPLLLLDGSFTQGASETLTGSYALYTQELARPGGGNWHWSDLDNLEVGVASGNGGGCKMGNCIRCTQLYVTITYTPYFEEIDGKGHIESPYVEPELVVTNIESDLIAGADADDKLLRTTAGQEYIVGIIPGNTTEYNYWYTDSNDPLNDDWETGCFLFTWNPYGATSGNLRIRFRVSRIEDDGTLYESTDWSDWKQGDQINSYFGLSYFVIPTKTWTGTHRTDRLRLDMEVENEAAGNAGWGMYVNDGSTNLRSLVHQWRTDTIEGKGHVIPDTETRDDSITGKGHVLQIRSDTVTGKGHILQERSDTVLGKSHVLQIRSDTIAGKGHTLQERSDTVLGKGHVLQARTKDITGKGHVLQIKSGVITGKGHILGTKSGTILGKGHVLQIRSDTILGKGHIQHKLSATIGGGAHVLQIRSDTILGTGYVIQSRSDAILNALAVQLDGLSEINKAVRILLLPIEARKQSPYAGLISGNESVVVEDKTHIRYELDADLILLKKGRDIEEMLDAVKNLLYSNSLAATVGALQIRIIGQEEVALTDADLYSSMRIVMTITYTLTKE